MYIFPDTFTFILYMLCKIDKDDVKEAHENQSSDDRNVWGECGEA